MFKDPLKYHQRLNDKEFDSPRKERTTTGRFMQAGSDYGVGFRNPVGHKSKPGKSPIPQEAQCFPCDQAIRK